ncbi:MAG: ABC transporter ATP-binding protein [Brevinematales bacterium]|nr:ABC transporter ATP-binding protein [Brevinematales bacterium]
MTDDILIRAAEISKTYKTMVDEVMVFEKQSIEIGRGTAVAIIGESGRGKTTLLNILSGLDNPSEGSILFDNQRIDAMDERDLAVFRNKNVGFIFQHHYLLQDFHALDNILLPLRIAGVKLDSARLEKVWEMLEKIGLKDRAYHFPDQLSGGERQRIAIARALANDPLVVFADEPTGSLDRRNASAVEDLLWRLKLDFNKTFVIATHNPDIAHKCDQVVELK